MDLRKVDYNSVRPDIRNGYLVFWRPVNAFGRLVSDLTNGPYSHVSSLSWAGDVLECHEMLQWYGGRTANFSALLRQYPGKADVYCVCGLKRNYQFSQNQRRRAGEEYAWRTLKLSTLYRLFGFRGLPKLSDLDVSDPDQAERYEELLATPLDKPAFCSQAIVSDLRLCGVNVYDEFAAWEIDPNMLSVRASYLFTPIIGYKEERCQSSV